MKNIKIIISEILSDCIKKLVVNIWRDLTTKLGCATL